MTKCMTGMVVKVGVTCTRFVSLPNARPWVIHAYRNIKGRGLHIDEDEDNSLPTDKIDEGWKETLQQKEKQYFYTEPVKEKAATLEGLGDDKIAINQDSKETSVKQSVEGQSPKRRKVDTEKDREPKNEEQRVPLDKVETGNSRTVSKRKLPTPTNTETNAGFKKRKICDPNESFDNATEHLKMDTKNDIGTTDKNLSSNTNKQEETKNDKNKKESNDAKEEDNLKEETSEGVRKKRIRKIKLPEDATDNKQNNDYAVSTYDKVRLIIQPWRKPEGGINKPIFKMMLESIMLYLMMNPGSPEDALVKRYNPYLQPMIIRNIVDVLEDIGCVSRQFISKPKPSLFSKPSIPLIGGEEEEDSTVLMVPAEDCVIKLGQFGQEVFPNAKWPENTYLPHERDEMTEKLKI